MFRTQCAQVANRARVATRKRCGSRQALRLNDSAGQLVAHTGFEPCYRCERAASWTPRRMRQAFPVTWRESSGEPRTIPTGHEIQTHRSVAHNLADSFLSAMNSADDQYAIDALALRAVALQSPHFEVDLMSATAAPPEFICEDIASSIRAYASEFRRYLTDQRALDRRDLSGVHDDSLRSRDSVINAYSFHLPHGDH